MAASIPIDSVLFLGDSVARDLALGVDASLGAAGLAVASSATPGASLTAGLFLEPGETWLEDRLPEFLEAGDEDLVVWVLSKWDLDAPAKVSAAAVEQFVDLALADHQQVLFVTMPPLRDDDAARGSATLLAAVAAAAIAHPGQVGALDATPLWGTEFVGDDGTGFPLRKPDGIHVCPLGAARFGEFLAATLADRYGGFQPADSRTWATGRWWQDARYNEPPGVCTPS